MMRILVVDDIVDAAEGLSTLFNAMGHETRVAFDGWGALDIVRSFKPRVVFLDLNMPLLDGYEAALAIRRDASIAQPHLVALTGSQGAAVDVAVKAAGFDSYMHKPANTMALIAIVTEIASRP